MSPARVSNAIDLPAIPRSEANRAAHRPPFPHISAADPSALKNFHRKSARRDRPRKMIPSAPIDRERSHTFPANAGRSIPFITPFRLSIRRKSFPLPFSLEKEICFFTSAPPPPPPARRPPPTACRGAGARVVGGGHREAVGAGAHARDEVARRKGGEF